MVQKIKLNKEGTLSQSINLTVYGFTTSVEDSSLPFSRPSTKLQARSTGYNLNEDLYTNPTDFTKVRKKFTHEVIHKNTHKTNK